MPEKFEESYPEHVKLAAVSERSQVIGEFLDWMESETDMVVCVSMDLKDIDAYPEEQYVPVRKGIERLLAEYFDIDMKTLEEEKRAMLKELRNAQDDS